MAIATIWGWIVDDPIDVAGPARSAVNRTALVGSYAQDCVTRWLTATAAHQQITARLLVAARPDAPAHHTRRRRRARRRSRR